MRTYAQEEKQAVIERVISGEPSAHILADTGIPKSTFYSWLRIYREKQNTANRRTMDIRNFHLLENKVTRLESIVEILKSATCTPKSPLKQRLYAAEQLYGKYNVHVICDAFESKSVTKWCARLCVIWDCSASGSHQRNFTRTKDASIKIILTKSLTRASRTKCGLVMLPISSMAKMLITFA